MRDAALSLHQRQLTAAKGVDGQDHQATLQQPRDERTGSLALDQRPLALGVDDQRRASRLGRQEEQARRALTNFRAAEDQPFQTIALSLFGARTLYLELIGLRLLCVQGVAVGDAHQLAVSA